MKKLIMFFSVALVLISCGKDGQTPIPDPVKAILISPGQNEICSQGTILSATQSVITLKWEAAANTDSYNITVKNLDDMTSISQTSTTTTLDVTLKRNTPYSWFVTSKSSASTVVAKSDIWKFYNSGPAIVSYAPFPADIISPIMDQAVIVVNGKITLNWADSDVDNDIIGYDIYFGLLTIPDLLQSNVTTTTLTDVQVSAGKTYYWKIVTKDSKGNSATTGIYHFTTK